MSSSTNPAVKTILDKFRRRLLEHFGSLLVGLILFGSYARGEAGADSDIDVAVVLDRVESHAERIWPMQLSGEFDGPVLTPIVLSQGELALLRAREDVLAENLDREARRPSPNTPRHGYATRAALGQTGLLGLRSQADYNRHFTLDATGIAGELQRVNELFSVVVAFLRSRGIAYAESNA